jgi:hypothetical protein
MGHSPARIARALGEGTNVRTVRRLLAGEDTAPTPAQLERIRDLYEAWWDLIPPQRTRGERVAASAARRRAQAGQWCTGAGLDDDALDTLGYFPRCAWRPAAGTGVATDNPLKVRRPYR